MILITGATGFIGRNLAAELAKTPRRVRCLARDPARAAFLKDLGCEVVKGDINDISSVLDALGRETGTVIHLVGILAEAKGAGFRKIHVEGTRNVVEASEKRGVRRYLHISALGARPHARSSYHRTKWEAEEIIRGSRLEHTIFRPSVVFGKEDRFTNLFASIIRLSPVVFIPGDGKNRMQPVFVKDLARAMAASLEMAETVNRAYEIGGPRIYTFDETIDEIGGVLGKKRIKLHVPMPLMRFNALAAESILSYPPVTRDQLLMLEEDNITANNALSGAFNIAPTGFAEGMRSYLR